MSAASNLISRLARVRQTGPYRWAARCPAHEDRRPSLSIREVEDGRVLLHCHAGCAVDAVVSAVGLRTADLFPPREHIAYERQQRRGIHPVDALHAIAFEATIVLIAARDMNDGASINDRDMERLAIAVKRIHAALGACNV